MRIYQYGRVRGKVKGRGMKLRFIAALMNHMPPIIKRVTNSLYAIKFRGMEKKEEGKEKKKKKNTLLMIVSDIYRIWKRFPGESFIVCFV